MGFRALWGLGFRDLGLQGFRVLGRFGAWVWAIGLRVLGFRRAFRGSGLFGFMSLGSAKRFQEPRVVT